VRIAGVAADSSDWLCLVLTLVGLRLIPLPIHGTIIGGLGTWRWRSKGLVVRLLIIGHLLVCGVRGLFGGGLRVAHLEIVIDLSHPGHVRGDGLGQLAGRRSGNRAGKAHLALNGGGGDEIILERAGGVECTHHIHLDLTIGALAVLNSWRAGG
jgi:hypothetical protein